MFCKKCGNTISVRLKNKDGKVFYQFNFWGTYVKAFFLTAVVFLIFSGIIGSFEDGIGEVLLTSLIIGALIGLVIAIIIKHITLRSTNSLKNDNSRTFATEESKTHEMSRRNGIIMLFFGCLLIFLNIARGGGFVNNNINEYEAFGYNMTSFALYLIGLVLVVKGVRKIKKPKTSLLK